MRPRLVFLLIGLAVSAIAIGLLPAAGRANHPQPDEDPNHDWGYEYTMWDFYPSTGWPNWGGGYRDHNLRYRVCITYGNEGGYAAWDWTHRFGFNPQSTLTATRVYDCGASSDALYWVTTDDNVENWCVISTAIGCFFPADWDYDSYVGRHEITEVIIPVKQPYMDSVSRRCASTYSSTSLGTASALRTIRTARRVPAP